MRAGVRLAAGLLMGAALAGCLRTEVALTGLEAGWPAPPLAAPADNGQVLRLEDFRGKVVLLKFGHAA